MKAGMNGVLNLSILDGWWDEGYDGDNGFAIKPASPELEAHRRDREEARTLYEILQDHVVPLYYQRPNSGANAGYSPEWIRIAKRSMASLLPRYDASRMLGEYVSKYYLAASHQGRRYSDHGYEGAKTMAQWKARVRAAWPGVAARRLDTRRRASVRRASRSRSRWLNGLAPATSAWAAARARHARAPMVQHNHSSLRDRRGRRAPLPST
jgi:starch phosphorylase